CVGQEFDSPLGLQSHWLNHTGTAECVLVVVISAANRKFTTVNSQSTMGPCRPEPICCRGIASPAPLSLPQGSLQHEHGECRSATLCPTAPATGTRGPNKGGRGNSS